MARKRLRKARVPGAAPSPRAWPPCRDSTGDTICDRVGFGDLTMLALLLATALSVATPLSGAPPPPAPEPAEEIGTVVVTAPDPRRALEALKACLARGCPAAEDMRLSLLSADESFLAGDYRQARATLDEAIGRNRRHGKAQPVLMANLYKADNTVNRHLGRGTEAYGSARNVPQLLERRYGQGSPESLWARLEAGDALLNIKRFWVARGEFLAVEEAARSQGLRALEEAAALRLAFMPALYGDREKAKARLQRLIDAAGPDGNDLATAAGVLKLKLLPREKQDAAAARLISDYAARREPVSVVVASVRPRTRARDPGGFQGSGRPAAFGRRPERLDRCRLLHRCAGPRAGGRSAAQRQGARAVARLGLGCHAPPHLRAQKL